MNVELNLVAGGGMIGSNVARILKAQCRDFRVADKSTGHDFRDRHSCMVAIDPVNDVPATRVFHLADYSVGIDFSSKHHGQMMTNSLLISLNLMDAARELGVRDYLYVSSSCVYPDHLTDVMIEDHALRQTPETANQGYGWAKRIGEQQALYYAHEHGIRTVIVRPANIYGPSYDWNNPSPHVIPSLIRKMLRGDPEIYVWGSGKQTRTFQYEHDTARFIVELMDCGISGEAYNLGGHEISIRGLAHLLLHLCDYRGTIYFDSSKPEGPIRKAHNTDKLLACLGHAPNLAFEEGLGRTIEAARKAIR